MDEGEAVCWEIGWVDVRIKAKEWSRFKPPWLTTFGALAILLQIAFTILLLFALTANSLGFTHQTTGVEPLTGFKLVLTLLWAFLALVAAVGLWRNRWWSYILELVLFWSGTVVGYFAQTPGRSVQVPLENIPIFKEIHEVLYWLAFAYASWFLLHRGLQLWGAQRPKPIRQDPT